MDLTGTGADDVFFLLALGTPDQHRQTNRLYRQMRIGSAARELAHEFFYVLGGAGGGL